ncbi:protein prenyltransferase alpha subunit repeat-containing protein 1 [Aplochiton taeniatus]
MAESEEEVDVLVQRVVKDINNAFKRNPNIDEIGLIPCPEARYNRSPIVLQENKLGVESWCVKFLLPYVHHRLLLYRQRKHWLDREALVDITCTLLLLNPDFTTAWNVRKELLQSGALTPEKDLYLGKLALTKFPKSPETWIHRRWVLQQVLRECSLQGPDRKELGEADERAAGWARHRDRLRRVLHDEMKVCTDAAARYPSNYNAWSHRIWVLQNMTQGDLKVLHDERSSLRHWVSMHVSDHSGFHYRQFLLKTLVRELSSALKASSSSSCSSSPQPRPSPATAGPTHQNHLLNHTVLLNGEVMSICCDEQQQQQEAGLGAVVQLFHQEMALCTDLIQTYPGHEALWCHRRHVVYLWHHWRKDHGPAELQSCFPNGDRESLQLQHPDPGLSLAGLPPSCGGLEDSSRNGQPAGTAPEAMEVEGVVLLPDPCSDTKRLKRGGGPSCPLWPPLLPSEYSFIAGVLDDCNSGEQRRFARAYRKWLDSVIGQ